MKFGDLVRNEWAGVHNPQKILMVIYYGKIIKCLTMTGKEVLFDNDKDLKLTKIGLINLSQWKTLEKSITDSKQKSHLLKCEPEFFREVKSGKKGLNLEKMIGISKKGI